MKKLLALVLVAGMVAFVSCGPSKKDQALAKEKRTNDSLVAVAKEKRTNDSLTAIHVQDSIQMKHVEDSLAELKKKPQGNYGGGQHQQQQQVKPTKPVGKG